MIGGAARISENTTASSSSPRYEVGIVAIHRVNTVLGITDGPLSAKLAISNHVEGLAAEFQIAHWGEVSVVTSTSVDDLMSAIAIIERVTSEFLMGGFIETGSAWLSERALASERSVLCEIFKRNSGAGAGRPRNKKCFLSPGFVYGTLCAETQRRLAEALKRSRIECDFLPFEWRPFLRSADEQGRELSLVLFGILFELFDRINIRAAAQGRAKRIPDLAIEERIRDIHVELMRLRTERRPRRTLLIGEDDYRELTLYAAEDSKPLKELNKFVDQLRQAPLREMADLLIDDLSAYVRRQIEQQFAPNSIYDVPVSRLLDGCLRLHPRFVGRPKKAAEIVGSIQHVWRALAGPTGNRITWDGAIRSGDCVELIKDITRTYGVDLPLSVLHRRGLPRRA